MNIEVLPSKIKMSEFMNAMHSLGVAISTETPIVKLEFDYQGLYFVVEALNDEGRPYIDSKGELALHRVFIPFTHGE